MAVIIGLIALVYNTMAADLKEVETKVEKVDEKKVDNKTLQLMLKNQKMMIEQQKEEAERQREEDAKKFEQIQQTQQKTLERIEQQQRVAPPKEFRVKSNSENVREERSEAARTQHKRTLTPEQFERYLLMKPEIQEKYKKYLESRGYDVEGL